MDDLMARIPDHLLIHLLTRISPFEWDPHISRATCKRICSLYDQDDGVWHGIVLYYEPNYPAHHTWLQAKQRCDEGFFPVLEALLEQRLPKSRVDHFVQSQFQILDLSGWVIVDPSGWDNRASSLRSLPEGTACLRAYIITGSLPTPLRRVRNAGLVERAQPPPCKEARHGQGDGNCYQFQAP